MTTLLRASLMLSLWATSALADEGAAAPQPAPSARRHFAELELNPVIFGLGGYGVDVAVRTQTEPQLRFQLLAFALKLPSFGLSKEVQAQGWSAFDRGWMVGGTYYFRDKRGGANVALDLGFQTRELSRQGVATTSSYAQLLVAPTVAYQWFPSDTLGLYLAPTLSFGIAVADLGKAELEGQTFQQGRVVPLATVYLGWEL